jgi:leucyl aminopeptidase
MEVRVNGGTDFGTGALVVFVDHEGKLSDFARAIDERTGGMVRRLAGHDAQRRKHGRIQHVLLPPGLDNEHLLVVTLGKDQPVTRLELEELGGAVAQRLHSLKVGAAVLGATEPLSLAVPEPILAIARGTALRSYRFDRYRAANEEEEDGNPRLARLEIAGAGDASSLAEGLARLQGHVAAVTLCRDLVNEPANALGPAEFADRCRELEGLGVTVEVMAPERLAELGMRALLAVGQGSARPPRVVVMRWRGAQAEAPVALVGKGVCFDSGGISIKPAGGMEDMKMDMAGAAAVVGSLAALASRKARADVVGVIGLAENMPSGTAQRPGDVVKAMSGKSIEVINTDAEGRLLLADVLWYTKETFKPRAIIDLATLTGAIIVALGHERAGLFASDDTLAQRLTAAAEAIGEPLWRMPLGKEYAKHIKSEVAEIKNVGRARQAGATAGAVFLEHFVGDIPWAHLDIAGTAWTSRDLPLAGKGATGFGVRLLDELVRAHYETE